MALAAVPLAALALSAGTAHAGTLTPGSCYVSNNGGSGSCTFTSPGTGGAGDLTWIQMFGQGSSASGGYLDFGNSGSGTATGTVGAETIPVSWLFSVSGGNLAADPVSYAITIGLTYSGGSGGSIFVDFNQMGQLTAPGTVSGSASFNIPAANITGWEIQLSTNEPGSDSYSINIPGGATIDLNPSSSTPEPGSMLLMGAGGAALLMLRRRKRA